MDRACLLHFIYWVSAVDFLFWKMGALCRNVRFWTWQTAFSPYLTLYPNSFTEARGQIDEQIYLTTARTSLKRPLICHAAWIVLDCTALVWKNKNYTIYSFEVMQWIPGIEARSGLALSFFHWPKAEMTNDVIPKEVRNSFFAPTKIATFLFFLLLGCKIARKKCHA